MRIVPTTFGKLHAYTVQGIHDGYLTGLALCDGNELHLGFRSLEGSTHKLIVPKLVSLKADDFRQGNIVLDVNFYEAQSCPDYILREAFGYDEEEGRKYLPNQLQRLQEQPSTLIEVTSSYGCSLAAVFRASVGDVVIQAIDKSAVV